MTEDGLKKVKSTATIFMIIACLLLIVIGIIVFGTSNKEKSIFKSQTEIDNYKSKVQQLNSHQITEAESEELENSEEFASETITDSEQESIAEEVN